jgi:hypothetical protein
MYLDFILCNLIINYEKMFQKIFEIFEINQEMKQYDFKILKIVIIVKSRFLMIELEIIII